MYRSTIGLFVTLAFAILVAPLAADAPPLAKIRTIGFLAPVSPSTAARHLEAFRKGLRELGWVGGQNIALEYRFNPGEDRLSNFAAERVHLKMDVIVRWGTPAGLTAKQATTTIPIVSYSVDLVRTGLVASLARPGGNIMGIATFASDLAGKRLHQPLDGHIVIRTHALEAHEVTAAALEDWLQVGSAWSLPDGQSGCVRCRQAKSRPPSSPPVAKPQVGASYRR
jgi:hypothetical protein